MDYKARENILFGMAEKGVMPFFAVLVGDENSLVFRTQAASARPRVKK